MSQIKIGQRYISETEPELGLGMISNVESKTIKISFLASKTERTYGISGAPLKRVIFNAGDEVSLRNGEKYTVESIIDNDGTLTYLVNNGLSCDERELSDSISFNKPEERLFNGNVDSIGLFNLRFKTHWNKHRITKGPVRGFIGGRMALLPHQFYVAHQIADRPIPRVLLADEVGLGKTIEAGLALHHLILSERVKRAVIIVPDSLVYQWFVEMLRKFNLLFTTLNQETYLEPETNPFHDNDFVIVNIGLFKGAPMALEMMKQVKWDLMIVDEAHQLKWSQEKVSLEYQIVERISKQSKGLLLLTATPEQLGFEGHFARLKLLDPNRFFDYHQFLEEMSHYASVAQKARELAAKKTLEADCEIQRLQDLHGTGRIFFRNTRARMGHVFSFFPTRIMHPYALEQGQLRKLEMQGILHDEEFAEVTLDLKLDWLRNFLNNNKTDKILLITKSKNTVLTIEKYLKEQVAGLNVGVFHSGLSFLARDRQAVYFADSEGAQILLCTEIGSEGRNFEFAHHLILFDLPLYPDLLEQRIGRLDRIGQTSDIHIHVPYVLHSYEEILFNWYHEGFNAFLHSAEGASLVHQQLQSLLEEYLNKPEMCLAHPLIFQEFLATTKKEYAEVVKKLEDGRDVLIELNSFNAEKAEVLLKEIRKIDEEADLANYMNEVFQELGVDIEDLEDNIYYIKPSDNMYVPYFPGLKSNGVRITFDRTTARRREDVEFLTWDHPMVVGAMDLILSNTFGNVTVMMRKKTGPSKVFIEAYFKLYAIAPKNLSPERYFPPTPIRILIDSTGEDFTDKWNKENIDEKSVMADMETVRKAKTLPKPAVQKILKMAHQYALKRAEDLKNSYQAAMMTKLTDEKERLVKLQELNPIVRTEEIEALSAQMRTLAKSYSNADVVLDAIRIIF